MLRSLLPQVILMSPKFFSQLLHFCWILSGATGATSSIPRRTSTLNPHLARVDDVSKHCVPTSNIMTDSEYMYYTQPMKQYKICRVCTFHELLHHLHTQPED
jgi:hypothetical protein